MSGRSKNNKRQEINLRLTFLLQSFFAVNSQLENFILIAVPEAYNIRAKLSVRCFPTCTIFIRYKVDPSESAVIEGIVMITHPFFLVDNTIKND